MKKIIFFLLLLVFPLISKAQESQNKVAVYVIGDINQGYRKVFGAKIVSNIASSNKYIAVERTADFLSALARENDYQTSGVVSNSQIAKLGEQFGVHFVVVVDASEVFESIFVSARMINVESAQIMASIECDGRVDSMESLNNLALDISETLIGELMYPGLLNKVIVKGPSLYPMDLDYDIAREYRISDIESVRYIAKSLSKRGRNVFPVVVDIKVSIPGGIDFETGYHEKVCEMTFLRSDGTIGSKTMRQTGRDKDDGGFVFSAWSGVDHAYYILVAPLY